MALKFIRTLALPALLAMPALAPAPASAVEQPRQAVPYSWSGFYIGANVGKGWGKADVSASGLPVGGALIFDNPFYPFLGLESYEIPIDHPFSSFSQSGRMQGLIGGAQFGFNVQSGAFVFGLEADFQGSLQKQKGKPYEDFSDSASLLLVDGRFADITLNGTIDRTLTTRYQTAIDWFGTVRGRAGLAIDNALFYATGGLAYGRVGLNGTTGTTGTGSLNICLDPVIGSTNCLTLASAPFDPNVSSFGATQVKYGWALGGGVEWAWTKEISFKAEYLYMDLGSITAHGTSPSDDDYTVRAKFTNQIARVGFNYRFGGSPF